MRPETRGEQLEDAEFYAGAVECLEDRAKRIWRGGVRKGHDREVVIIDSLDPQVVDAFQSVERFDPLVVGKWVGYSEQPFEKPTRSALQNTERHDQPARLCVKGFMLFYPRRVGALVEYRVLKILALDQLIEIDVIAVIANAEERL